MTRSPLWREFESGDSWLLHLIRWAIILGGSIFLIFAAVLDLTWPQQLVLGLLTVLIAIWMDKSSSSYLVTLTLMLVSCFSTLRYGYWRISYTIKFFLDPGTSWNGLDMFFIVLLVLAESYAFVILFLGYLQTLWPLRRTPVPLPEDPDEWPAVDLLIPTYNEPLSVVRFTALAAMNIDWPADKLNVYILDDGRREEFRRFAEDAGIGYMTRDDNKHAKAGNINRALERLDAPFVAIFDSDHVPTRSFLQVTLGWFLRDRKLAMLQTPHHFYSPDPFERNLDQFRVIPNEGELFYGIVQDGNDFWNATFFCGSCAVLRRTALDEIGGIAVETVTEDAHTSLRMQMNGWNTAYINIPQAAGLATERLSGHVKQRIRWARGMIQILRTDNPLFAPGLSAAQRLCYFNAMTHFLYALPRLIFLTAPLIYLILGHTNVPGYWAAILAYAFPHLILSVLTNSRIQGQHRHSFWNETYETVLAPYIFLPTMLALLNPKLGSFNVTAKGGVVNRSFFDARIAQPFLVLLLFNFTGLLMAIPRFHLFNVWPLNLLYDGMHPGTIVMNVLWTIFNIVVLGVATAVAWESQQRRQTVRVAMSVPADVILADGTVVQGVTADLSSGGCMMQIDRSFTALPGESVQLIFPVLDGDASLPATVISATGGSLRAQFDPLTLQEEEALTMVLYSRADTWLGWGEAREADRPLTSLARIFRLSFQGLSQTTRGLMKSRKRTPKGRLATNVAPLLLFALFAGCWCASAFAAQGPNDARGAVGAPAGLASRTAAAPTRQLTPGQFDNTFSLADLGVENPIVLRGVDSYHSIYFSLPRTQVARTATMHLRYHFSPGLLPEISHLMVSLNGTLFATLPVTQRPAYVSPTDPLTPEQKVAEDQQLNVTRNETGTLLEATLTMPAEMLVPNNELTFEFIGHYTLQCEDPSHSTLWSHVDNTSTIELAGSLIQLPNDLSLMPLPFYDAAVNLHPSIPVVFLSQPSPAGLKAAGIIASYFGILTNDHPVRFPVMIGNVPVGNAVVISESSGGAQSAITGPSTSGPSISMRTNPNDPYSKLLVLSGDSGDDVVTAAQGLVLAHAGIFQGETATVDAKSLKLTPRQPDDAPRWLSTDRRTNIGEIAQTGDLQGDGSDPVNVYLRVPPDLYTEPIANLSYHMSYRYNGIPLANESSLQVYVNTAYVSSTPMPHTEKGSAVLQTIVPIPKYDMRPFSNTIAHKFVFQIAKKGKCQDTAPLNLQGAILKESYLDISGIPHWIILPDLEVFANAGYPFTRKADLADTDVVLPDAPTTDEIEMYLTMMGHFGAETGYPVVNVGIIHADGMKESADKDYLVMGTVEDEPALTRLQKSLPVVIDSNGLHVQDTQGFFAALQHAWWKVRSSDHVQSNQLETAGGLPDAMIEGIEWPKKHSTVVIALRDHTVVPRFLTAFLQYSQSSHISQSVSVLHDTDFTSYRIGNDAYRVGNLPLLTQIRLRLSESSWLVVIGLIVVCILLAALIRANLRRRARARLQGNV
jgi:cellulose synthase (UDP-forming)